ncbi:MAG TPA: hypothetical protein VJ852_07115 [Gemmatimonadaceae bacterium]|nr:hypothetical protein [Gemmatimonadaceae bacterium]
MLRLITRVIALAMVPSALFAQLNYGYTTFIHGFNDNHSRFTTPNTAGLLSPQVDLKTTEFPDLDGQLYIDTQATNLYNLYGGEGRPHVLVGHSMGGLTSRDAYFAHPNGFVAGIITLGTPHQGALIADNATRATGYVVNEVSDFFQNVIAILHRPHAGNILSQAAVNYIEQLATAVFEGRLQSWLNSEFGIPTQGLNDIKTTSSTVNRLKNLTDPLPHAAVLGTIGRRNAVFRVAYSAQYKDNEFDGFVHNKNRVKSIVKACRQIGWNFIIRTQVGRLCNQVDNALGSIDDRWAAWTMGPAEKRDPNKTFDGLVGTSHSVYPGESLTNTTVHFTAPTVNHLNIQYAAGGINKIVAAMMQIRMQAPVPPPPPGGLSVFISGANEVQVGCVGSWIAGVSGGNGAYHYVWTAFGDTYDTGSNEELDYSPTTQGSYSVQVTVTDTAGHSGSASMAVNVTSGNCA